MELMKINLKNFVELHIKLILIKTDKYHAMKCVLMLKNVSSLFYFIYDEKYFYFIFRDQHDREADDFISTLDPKNTNKIAFNTYVRDSYGDLDVNQLEKMDKSDSRSRETRRVRI